MDGTGFAQPELPTTERATFWDDWSYWATFDWVLKRDFSGDVPWANFVKWLISGDGTKFVLGEWKGRFGNVYSNEVLG